MMRILPLLMSLFLLAACADRDPFRTDITNICSQPPLDDKNTDQCPNASFQRVTGSEGYYLGFVEFDDQGQPLVARGDGDDGDPIQLESVVQRANELAGHGDIILVTFVHGWHHSAAPGDDNIGTFRKVLKGLSEKESHQSNPRPVLGVYVGWRGDSLTWSFLNWITFWDRKNTAAKIGHASVTQLFAELELIKRTRDAIARRDAVDQGRATARQVAPAPYEEAVNGGRLPTSRTRFVVVGHSFGGLIVHNTVGQILVDRAVRTFGGNAGYLGDIESFGDLVVLINPAFEARSYAPLRRVAAERKSFGCDQLPIEVILTSRNDDATRLAFPVGRWISSAFQHDGWAKVNTTAVGHYQPFITHDLSPGPQAPVAPGPCNVNALVVQQSNKVGLNLTPWPHGNSKPWPPRNPYMNISVDGTLITGHNDIGSDQIVQFITGLIGQSVEE